MAQVLEGGYVGLVTTNSMQESPASKVNSDKKFPAF
jgi:hypothetical protein